MVKSDNATRESIHCGRPLIKTPTYEYDVQYCHNNQRNAHEGFHHLNRIATCNYIYHVTSCHALALL